MRKKSNDQVVFLTLVDFLLQLIFFGLFVFVVVQTHQQKETDSVKNLPSWVLKEEFLPFITGLTPWVNADKAKELTALLKILDEKNLLADVLKFLRNNPNPIENLRFCATSPKLCEGIFRHCAAEVKDCEDLAGKGRSLGLPPCLPDLPRALFSAMLRRDDSAQDPYIEVTNITAQGRETFIANGIAVLEGEKLSLTDYERRFQTISRSLPNATCAHYVNYNFSKYDSAKFLVSAERVFGRERLFY